MYTYYLRRIHKLSTCYTLFFQYNTQKILLNILFFPFTANAATLPVKVYLNIKISHFMENSIGQYYILAPSAEQSLKASTRFELYMSCSLSSWFLRTKERVGCQPFHRMIPENSQPLHYLIGWNKELQSSHWCV